MTTYVAFLRGINVGAHNRMKMADLREALEAIGLDAVRTYIQSGNVVFESGEPDATSLEAAIADAIHESFGYDISVMVRPWTDLDAVVAGLPFDEPTDENVKLYVAFLAEKPADDRIEELLAAADDAEEFVVDGRAVYSRVRKDEMERGRSTDAGKLLGTAATRRTWNVVEKVREMGSPDG